MCLLNNLVRYFGIKRYMIYFVIDFCICCKFMDCVEVCLVDCFYEGENMFVIYLDECIDCGVCEFECLVEVIVFDIEDDLDGKWLIINKDFLEKWFNIIVKGMFLVDLVDFE